MRTDIRSDLRIIGDNNANGGNYRNAKIVGDSIINGDLDCLNFKSVGNIRVDGNVKADNARIVGSLSVTGSFESPEIRITGNVNASGDLKSKSLAMRGGMEIKGGVKAEDIRLTGYTTIKKNCEVDTFTSEGPLTISGLLNADDVDIRIHSRCRVGEIGGETIQVRKGHYSKLGEIIKSFFAPNDAFNARLIVDSVEGDEVRLENTKAKTVRGRNVVIEDGCEIDSLEYSNECRISGRSIVREKKKVASR